MQNYQDYFFEKQSEVLFIDEYAQRVGILKETPAYTLDVLGDISCSNAIATNIIANNGLINTVMSSNIISGDVETDTLQASMIVSSCNISQSNFNEYLEANLGVINDIHCSSLVAYSNINCLSNVVIGSNLALLNTWINQECPFPGEANYFGFNDQGWIHSSWIHTDPDMMALLGKLWDIGAAGWDIFDAVKDVYTYLNPTSASGALADDMKNTLNDALDQIDETPSSNQLSVSFWNLNNRPFVATTNYDLGVKGDMYINEAKSIYSLNGSYFVPNYKNNQTLASTIGKDLILNVGTKQLFINELNIGSNVYISKNSNNVILKNFTLTSNAILNSNASLTFNSNSILIDTLNTSNITSSNLTGQNVKVGSYTINSTGVYTDYDDILLRKKILDNQGNYLGSLYSSQVIGFDALNFERLKDGVMSWNGFNTNTSIDPFVNIGNPLYVI